MPRELHDLLAEGAPRDPGTPDLDAIESRARRRRAGRAGGMALAVLAVGALAVQAWPSVPDLPIVDEVEDGIVRDDGTTVLPLPAPGDVLPAHANGRPVFVVHTAGGDVRVLDAISPHDSAPNAMKVLAWCRTSGWFVDPWHGSQFADNGAWAGGPAPYGLAPHEVVDVTADTVVVGQLQAAPARGVLAPTEAAGEHCIDVEGTPDPDAVVLHTAVTDHRVAGLRYPEREDDRVAGDLASGPQRQVDGEPVTLTLPADDIVLRHVGQRPAIVLQHDSSDDVVRVTVLDGVNPHGTAFGPKVLTVCTSSDPAVRDVVHDPWYLSRFATTGFVVDVDGVQRGVPTGGWIGGPAPTGLARLPVLDAAPAAGDAITVTVLPTPLPPPPRVDLGRADLDDASLARLDDVGLTAHCGERDQLFPDMPPADPTLLDDLLLQEPLFPDLWWYPTPARLLGEEPGLPPDELASYLDAIGEEQTTDEMTEEAQSPCDVGDLLLDGLDVDADGAPDRLVTPGDVDASAVLCTGAGVEQRFGLGPVEALAVVDLGLGQDVVAIGGTSVSMRFVELWGWGDPGFEPVTRPLDCEGCEFFDESETLGLVDGLDPSGGSVDWGCLPARSPDTASVLVTVTVTPTDGGEVEVVTSRYDVADLTATPFDEATTTAPAAGEFQARDVLRDLGARIGCAP